MQYRFVIIGCGRIAHRHIAEANRIGHCVGVTDPDTDKLEHFRQLYRVPGFTTIEQLLAQTNAEVAVVCSPNYLHIYHITQAIQHGLDVLCEKPLCIHSSEAAQLAQIQADYGKKVFMVLSARFHGQVQRLRFLVREAVLGRVLSFQINACWNRDADYYQQSDWKGKSGKDGGILFTQFSHYIDAFTWCLGETAVLAVKRVNSMHQESISGEDAGVAILGTGHGAIGTLHWTVNSTVKNMEVSLLVVGEKGTIKIGGVYMDTLEYETLLDPAPKWENSRCEVPHGSHHNLIYDQLLLALEGQPHILPGIEAGLVSVKLIEEIYAFPQEPIVPLRHD